MRIHEIITEDWQKVNKHDKTDGLSRKAVKAYRRENPGSKLKTAVTTKPSKLKKGSKSAKRRKSFCSRMSGMKKHRAGAKTKRDPNSPINKALRRWNCESIEEMQELIMLGESYIANLNENFADGKNPGRKEIDPDVYEDLANSIIARIARQIVPTIRAKSTPEGYVYLSTQDGLSLMIGCNIAGGGIDINIGSQPMETTSSGPHKSAVTKIISAVYQAAVKRYGTPTEQGTLSIDHDAGHGVWQHIAQKLGLQYDANMVKENFADGRNPQDKGDSKRYGVPTHASVSTLRKVAHQGGRKGQLAHWMANMKSGKKKH